MLEHLWAKLVHPCCCGFGTQFNFLSSAGNPLLNAGTAEITATLNALSNEDLGTCLLRPSAFQELAGKIVNTLQVIQSTSCWIPIPEKIRIYLSTI